MKQKTIIHIIGADSSKRVCLTELKKNIYAAGVIFSYKMVLNAKTSEEIETHCLQWIRSQVKTHDTIITYGLPIKSAKQWIKKAYPECTFKNFVWEIHHNELSENVILKERSWRFLFEGILNHARIALKLGLSPQHELIRHTPLKLAIDYEHQSKEDIQNFIDLMIKHQEKNNEAHNHSAIICKEAMDPINRRHSIRKIAELIARKEVLVEV